MSLPIPSEPVSDADFREFYEKVARLYHYPECWDTVAYPTLYDAIYEMRGPCGTCGNYLPAEDPDEEVET